MSWIFGVKPPAPAAGENVADDQHFSGPGGGSGEGPPKKPPTGGDAASRMAYTFDSAALERAAKAAKDLEGSSNFYFL